jgi:hypothetical protein
MNVLIILIILLIITFIGLIRSETLLGVFMCFISLTIIAYVSIYHLKAD